MLPVEREMIGLLMKGAATPLDNIRVSFFLVAWSASLLGILRMAQIGKEKKAERQGNHPENRDPIFAKPEEEKEPQPAPGHPGGGSSLQPAKRRT